MANKELESASYDPVVDTRNEVPEVPSAAWGWSGESNRAMRIAAIVVAIFMLLMFIGNHEGRVEDLWLAGFAAVLVGLVVRDVIVRRKPR